MKRILFLADVNSSHTQKWVSSLVSRGFQIGLFSLSNPETDWFSGRVNLTLYDRPGFSSKMFSNSSLKKIAFLKTMPFLKKVIREFKPEIIHAHYASSYGLLGRLSGFHPYFISVWGSDLFEFPMKSFIHKEVVRRNLRSADEIFSTSKVLEDQVYRISGSASQVIPFGIDLEMFHPAVGSSLEEGETIVIGTIKSLEKNYRIDVLMKAFAIARAARQNLNLRLVLVGGGTEEDNLKRLAENLNIADVTEFKGRMPFDLIPGCHRAIDIFVNLSAQESFGVSVLEASASGKPVIVTNVGGLNEVVVENVTGLMVPVNDAGKTADCMIRLIDNRKLAKELGARGRKFVAENYDWLMCVEKMCNAYLKVK